MIRTRCSVSVLLLLVVVLASPILTVYAEPSFLKTWTLYHSMDGGRAFVRRGQIRLGAADADDVADGSPLELTIEQDDDENLNIESIQTMMQIGLYQLKLVEDGNEAYSVLTSVPACHVRRANFRDEISLVLNPHGHAISLSYLPLQSPLAPSCQELSEMSVTLASPVKFKSKVSYDTSTPGMVLKQTLPTMKAPPGLKFFVKSGGIPGQPAPDANEKPTSVFQRYWYVFLIFMVLQLVGAASEPAGGAGAAQARAAGAAPNSGAAAAAGQRRGKRD